ncbi:MAG: sugar ABC transporter substrate-binding protein [Anaerolineae bacterium]
MMMRRLIHLFILSLIGMLALACAPTPVPTVQPTPAQGGKVILKVGTGDSGQGLQPHRLIIDQFQQANPDIQVQIESVEATDYYGQLLDEIQKGTAPDLMQIGDDAVPMFVQKGALVNLGPYIQGTQPLDQNIYLPGVLQPGQWNGAQYLLPKDFSPLAIYYNKKLFDQYQVPYPKDGWTWQDFLKTAQAFTAAPQSGGVPQVWGVQLPGTWTGGFEYWVAAAGGSLISEDGKKFQGYMDSAASAEALRFYIDLYKNNVAPPMADIKLFQGGNTEFARGKAAMWLSGHWPEADLRKNASVDLGVVGMPVGKKRANVLFWSGFGINSQSKNKDAAWRFLRFYVGIEGAKVWKDWGLPTVRSVAESSGLTKDPIEGVWLNELNYLVPRGYIFTSVWGDTADTALQQALEQGITNPGSDAAALMKTAAQHAQQALDAKK